MHPILWTKLSILNFISLSTKLDSDKIEIRYRQSLLSVALLKTRNLHPVLQTKL